MAELPRLIRALLTVFVIGALAILTVRGLAPPSVPASSAPTEFSATRALAQLATVAQRPRRPGSPAHHEARETLLSRLGALGLEAETQEATVLQIRYVRPEIGRPARMATVRNVIGRLRGAAVGPDARSIVLTAHYDSRSMTPGASDDGYGVAVLLEVARALRAGAPPAHDVIFLFTDAEEEGLLGARAFVQDHPLARRAGVVLNVEARGNGGPSIMFQTSEGAGGLVRALAQTSPRPAANSLTQAVYRRMPNDTDLTEWLPTGVAAMNFANVEGFERYHAATDSVDAAEPRTLQHHGAQVLALARHFDAGPLPPPREVDAQYFGAGPLFVHYPEPLARWFASGAAALFLTACAWAVKRRLATLRGLAIALGGALLVVLGATLAASGELALVHRLRPEYASLPAVRAAVKWLLLASGVATAIAAALFVQGRVARRITRSDAFAGAGLLWCGPTIASAVWLPGAAFLFTWPLVFAAAAWLARIALARWSDEQSGPWLLHLAGAVPAIVVVVPLLAQVSATFDLRAMPALAAGSALLACLLAPSCAAVASAAPRGIPAFAASVAVAAFSAGAAAAPFDTRSPRPDALVFAIDADAGAAFWLTTDEAPDAWSRGALAAATWRDLPALFPLRKGPVLARPTPAPRVASPHVDVLGDDRSGALRTLHLRVFAPDPTEVLALHVASGLRAARVRGVSVPLTADGGLALYYSAPPRQGLDLSVDLAGPGAPPLAVVAQWSGFPAGAEAAPAARPEGLAPRPGTMPPWDELLESDMTVVARHFPL